MTPAATVSTVDLSKAPAAPAHFPEAVAARWKATYLKALAQAEIDTPDNGRLQRIAALKAANAMLTVPAPKSAADIDALEDWQIATVNGKPGSKLARYTRDGNRICVAADGRKYSFPLAAEKPAKAAEPAK